MCVVTNTAYLFDAVLPADEEDAVTTDGGREGRLGAAKQEVYTLTHRNCSLVDITWSRGFPDLWSGCRRRWSSLTTRSSGKTLSNIS